jgi:hypothetical protein
MTRQRFGTQQLKQITVDDAGSTPLTDRGEWCAFNAVDGFHS